MKATAVIFTAVLMAAIAWMPAATQDRQMLFEKALALEEAQGKLQEAIALYQKIVDESNDQALAAQAQLRIGICHQKLGSKAAQGAFQRVIDNYPGQAEAVRLAQERLSLLVKAQAVVERKDNELGIRQIRIRPNLDIGGAPSPDGRYLSGVDWETGDLAVLDLATGAHRRLTNKGAWDKSREFAEFSIWSPDSKLLAYSWYTDPDDRAEVRIIRIDGGSPRILCSEQDWYDTPVSWSPDGTRIAVFRRSKKGDLIAQARVADGSIRVLKSLEPFRSYSNYWVRLSCSPDGRYLAYDFPVANNAGKFDISLLAADGSGEIPLVRHPANDRLLGWIKDTSEILFSSDRYGTEDAWAVRVVNNRPQDPPELIRRSVGEIRPMGFTRDGAFYFGVPTRQFTIQIASYDREKAHLEVSTEKTLLGSNIGGQWSPDGECLLYMREEKAGQGRFERGIHIRNLRTGEERELALEFDARDLAKWSPDGRSIVVAAKETNPREADYKGGIYQIDVDSRRVARLTLFSGSEFAWFQKEPMLWSRVGVSVIYADRGCLWARELKSGQEKELYCHANFAPFSAISPNGREFAFGTIDQTKSTVTIWTMPVEGGNPSRLLTVPASKNVIRTVVGIDWTPDGNYLVYAIDTGNGYGISQIPASGGDPQKLYHSKDQMFVGLDVHPDGKQIALSTGVQADEVWVMENFLPIIKR